MRNRLTRRVLAGTGAAVLLGAGASRPCPPSPPRRARWSPPRPRRTRSGHRLHGLPATRVRRQRRRVPHALPPPRPRRHPGGVAAGRGRPRRADRRRRHPADGRRHARRTMERARELVHRLPVHRGRRPARARACRRDGLHRDLVEHVDATYRTVEDRAARAVGGYSMGGAGRVALRTRPPGHVLRAHRAQPGGLRASAARGLLDPRLRRLRRRAQALRQAPVYRAQLPGRARGARPGLPVHLFIAVGDDEWANPDPADARHDLDFESAQLYNTARRVDGVTAELRVLDGGHDWDVWQPAFREAITDISARLRTAPAAPWDAELLGTSGDDRAGGVLAARRRHGRRPRRRGRVRRRPARRRDGRRPRAGGRPTAA